MSTTTTKQPCQCLRTKNPYGATPQNADSWLPGIHMATSYWCLRTMSPAGPNDHYVHLARCVPGRACYEQREEYLALHTARLGVFVRVAPWPALLVLNYGCIPRRRRRDAASARHSL